MRRAVRLLDACEGESDLHVPCASPTPVINMISDSVIEVQAHGQGKLASVVPAWGGQAPGHCRPLTISAPYATLIPHYR
jgi:hypothetical protein